MNTDEINFHIGENLYLYIGFEGDISYFYRPILASYNEEDSGGRESTLSINSTAFDVKLQKLQDDHSKYGLKIKFKLIDNYTNIGGIDYVQDGPEIEIEETFRSLLQATGTSTKRKNRSDLTQLVDDLYIFYTKGFNSNEIMLRVGKFGILRPEHENRLMLSFNDLFLYGNDLGIEGSLRLNLYGNELFLRTGIATGEDNGIQLVNDRRGRRGFPIKDGNSYPNFFGEIDIKFGSKERLLGLKGLGEIGERGSSPEEKFYNDRFEEAVYANVNFNILGGINFESQYSVYQFNTGHRDRGYPLSMQGRQFKTSISFDKTKTNLNYFYAATTFPGLDISKISEWGVNAEQAVNKNFSIYTSFRQSNINPVDFALDAPDEKDLAFISGIKYKF